MTNRTKDYIAMSVDSDRDRVRSHSWWKNLTEWGAWNGPGATRVGPPDPEALPGIAKLFATSVEQVAAMVAADWYGVHPDTELSARTPRPGPRPGLLERRRRPAGRAAHPPLGPRSRRPVGHAGLTPVVNAHPATPPSGPRPKPSSRAPHADQPAPHRPDGAPHHRKGPIMSSMPTVTALPGPARRRGICNWHGNPQGEITRSMRLEEHRKDGRRVALDGVCEAARTEIVAEVMKRQGTRAPTRGALSVRRHRSALVVARAGLRLDAEGGFVHDESGASIDEPEETHSPTAGTASPQVKCISSESFLRTTGTPGFPRVRAN